MTREPTPVPETGRIDAGQAATMTIALVLPTSALYVPSLHLVAAQARQDAWLSLVLATVGAVVVVAMIWRLSVVHPGRTFMQMVEIEWGPGMAKAVGALYFVGITVHGSLLLRAFAESIGLVILPKTPPLVIAASQMALCVYAARRGVEVLARISRVATLLLLLSLLTLFALAWNETNFDRLPPPFTSPLSDVIRGAVWPFMWFLQVQILGSVALPFVRSPRRAVVPLLTATLTGGIFLVAAVLIAQGVLGVHQAAHAVALLEKLAREVRPIEFLSRTEALYLFFWQAASFVEVTVFLYAGALEGSHLFALRRHQPLVAPIGFLMTLLGSAFYRSITDLVRFSEQVFPVYALVLGGLIPLLLLVSSLRARPGAG